MTNHELAAKEKAGARALKTLLKLCAIVPPSFEIFVPCGRKKNEADERPNRR